MNNQTDFYDIFGYYALPFYQTTFGKICIVCGIIAALLVIAYCSMMYRRQRKLTSWQWAEQALAALVPTKCLSKDDYKKLYFQMSGILKQYLHKRYGWATEDKTDDELITYLTRKKFDPSLLDKLAKLVEGAQWIKFANEDVLRNQAERDHATALYIVQQTRPQDAQQSIAHV